MDIKNLMRQAQEMQKKMQIAQEELAKTEYEGTAGGGMVSVVMSGSGIMKKITIDQELVKAEEKDILEDLIVVATNDAKKKADEASNNSLKSATGNVQLPAGFGF